MIRLRQIIDRLSNRAPTGAPTLRRPHSPFDGDAAKSVGYGLIATQLSLH